MTGDFFDEEIRKAEEHLRILREKRLALWPKPWKASVHAHLSIREDDTLGFTKEEKECFWPLIQVDFEGFVYQNGKFEVHKVNGVKLETPTVM